MPELPEVRERIAAAIHGSDYGRTCSSCLKRADAVLDVLNPPSREAISLAIHHALPTSVVLWDPVRRYGEWDVVQRDDAVEAVLRCVPVFTLSTEPEDAGPTVEAAEPCAPASPVGTPQADDGSDAALLARAQRDLADCLVALDSAQDALWTVTQEGDRYRWGRPDYDMTWDHVWECADAALKDVRAVWSSLAGPLAASTKENEDG